MTFPLPIALYLSTNVFQADENQYAAGHVEVIFRDVYLARADMWKMVVTELKGKGVYQGQQILFLGTIKATVRNIYVRGKRVPSAYFSNTTRPIFRSESARFVLYIQMSREMWDFDTEGTGGIMRSKVINGFLPELFKRWVKMNARHLVSIVLFTRVEYELKHPSGNQPFAINHHGQAYRDFYRVVVSEMDSGEWTTILYQLKAEFNLFLRDILLMPTTVHDPNTTLPKSASATAPAKDAVIAGRPSSSLHGNVLEAINLASSQFSEDYIDRDLVRTGLSIIIITPGTGVFEVDAAMLRLTTDNLVSNGVGIDIVCLARMPLHSVPLFRYRLPSLPDTKDEGSQVSSPTDSRLQFVDTGSFATQILGSQSSAASRLSFRLVESCANVMVGKGQEWTYAIPHWIDISFWTTSPHERHRTPRKIRAAWRSRHTAAAIFRPRCRMYELQMMGLMETEMSNISIPYLHDTCPEAASYMSKQRKGSLAPGLGQVERSPHVGATVLGSNSNRSREHRHMSREERDDHRWMDRHDEKLFRIQALTEDKRSDIQSQPLIMSRSDTQRPRYRPSVSNDYGLSKLGHSPGSSSLGVGSFLDQSMMRRRQEEAKKPGKGSNVETIGTASTARPRLAPKTSMFGTFRMGLGLSGPSKALAVTGATSESANSSPGLFRKPDEVEKATTLTTNSVARQVRASLSRNTSSMSVQTIKGQRGSKPISIAMSPRPVVHHMDDIEPMQLEQEDDTISIHHQRTDSMNWPLPPKRTESQLKVLAARKADQDDDDPWLTVLNPSNPRKNNDTKASRFRRWQHLFPRPPKKSSIKWKSLCAPASLPLTNEDFPSFEELRSEYQERPYRVALSEDDDMSEQPRSRSHLIRELIAFRLSHGFQIVVGHSVSALDGQVSNIFDEDFMGQDGSQMFMSKGNDIHQLSCIQGTEVQITRYQRRRKTADTPVKPELTNYNPLIKYALGKYYEARPFALSVPKETYNWSYIDNFIAGNNDDFSETLRFWRARFVLIPVDPPAAARKHVHAVNEDSDEEIRLEGIQKLTQIWQRNRHIPPEERYFQVAVNKRADPNPLAIEYQTRDPSVVVSIGLENSPLIETGDIIDQSSALLNDAELYRTTNVDLHKLAADLQSDQGIPMRDRRWHFKLHPNCFVGSDFTSWLLLKFRDVDSRDEAIQLGNQLMQRGLFHHVQKKHRFRDGNYFYEMHNEYKATRPDSRSSWFGSSRKSERSVPSTPVLEPIKDHHSLERYVSRTTLDESTSDLRKPSHTDLKRSGVSLSAVMQYDLDPRGKSYRPEVINLHYDRLHHPDNCYHIRIDWMNVTAKLIEDAIVTWATSAERYGLKLVEVPIAEASSITSRHPFRSPYIVELALQPPKTTPHHMQHDLASSSSFHDPHVYHKALLRKLDFVLDLEAASSFPADVKVKYSWGKPDYRYTQYIHKSGVVLAQITEHGNFLMLANRLCNYRAASAKDASKFSTNSTTSSTTTHPPPRSSSQDPHQQQQQQQRPATATKRPPSNLFERPSPFSSPLVRALPEHQHIQALANTLQSGSDRIHVWPEQLKDDIEAFCTDKEWLAAFYEDFALSSGSSVPASAKSTPMLKATVPKVGMPSSAEVGDLLG